MQKMNKHGIVSSGTKTKMAYMFKIKMGYIGAVDNNKHEIMFNNYQH